MVRRGYLETASCAFFAAVTWYDIWGSLRAAIRDLSTTGIRSGSHGFRLGRTLPP